MGVGDVAVARRRWWRLPRPAGHSRHVSSSSSTPRLCRRVPRGRADGRPLRAAHERGRPVPRRSRAGGAGRPGRAAGHAHGLLRLRRCMLVAAHEAQCSEPLHSCGTPSATEEEMDEGARGEEGAGARWSAVATARAGAAASYCGTGPRLAGSCRRDHVPPPGHTGCAAGIARALAAPPPARMRGTGERGGGRRRDDIEQRHFAFLEER